MRFNMEWKNSIIENLKWATEISNRQAKEKIAKEVADQVRDGETIGFGSGSTSFLAILAIGEKIAREGFHIKAITTSHEMNMTCLKLGIPTVSFLEARPDWCFDGADEVDSNKSLIKGRGGAMFKEKLVMASSSRSYILVDESKFVEKLGEKFAVPIEVVPMALNSIETPLEGLGATELNLRMATKKDGPVITENGNLIVDTKFQEISLDHEKSIKQIPGVLDSGLFIDYNIEVLSV